MKCNFISHRSSKYMVLGALSVGVALALAAPVQADTVPEKDPNTGIIYINDGDVYSYVTDTDGDSKIIINGGTVTGNVTQDEGNDEITMNGGTVGDGTSTGGIIQGGGSNTFTMNDGVVNGGVTQGGGVDVITINGGTITGLVEQSGGSDTFYMNGGTIGQLAQSEELDKFYMTDGHIIGHFYDGDYAEMSGGRIGTVDMKMADNTFIMSGGVIDNNLIASLGKDLIIMSGGYIGGNISISSGNDQVILSGGTVNGQIKLGNGNDVFNWQNGGLVNGQIVLEAGNDTTQLTNLNASNLGNFPIFDGGVGQDILQMNNVETNGIARFANWEQVSLNQGSNITFDGLLTLGDSGTGTGTLNVDATSAVLATGTSGGVVSFASGSLVSMVNAGRIDLSSNSTPGDAFSIYGHYSGTNGWLYLDTVLGDDASASDRLILSGNDASSSLTRAATSDTGGATGTTSVNVFNAGGAGASTQGDGILVIQSINSAQTTDDAFQLGAPVIAGAFEYFLVKGGATDGASENWYLRSMLSGNEIGAGDSLVNIEEEVELPNIRSEIVLPTELMTPPTPEAIRSQRDVIPLYRLETPTYAVLPSLLRVSSRVSLGTFNERQGDQRLLAQQGDLRAAWVRLIGSNEDKNWQGDALTSFNGSLQGVQAGVDLFVSQNDHLRSQWGLFIGRTRAIGDISGFAWGWENFRTGQTRMDDTHLALSWTGTRVDGAYIDAVLMRNSYRGKAWSTRGLGIKARGEGTTASVEFGKPSLHFGDSAWWLEPQLQVIWQQQSIHDATDAVANIHFNSGDSWTGRAGVRLMSDYTMSEMRWQPYATLNYWKTLDGDDRVDFNSNRIVAEQGANEWEIGLGVIGHVNDKVSFYGELNYGRDLEDHDNTYRDLTGNLGLRFSW